MRFRVVAVTAVALASLAACSSSGGDSDGGSTDSAPSSVVNTDAAGNGGESSSAGVENGGATDAGDNGDGDNGTAAAFCTKLKQAPSKLGDLSSASSDPSKLPGVLQKEIDYFTELKDAAPAELNAPLTDMVNLMTAAKKAVENPSSADTSALQKLASKLPQDAQKLQDYAMSHCTGS